jgi:ketosteroid isomerase-like protein
MPRGNQVHGTASQTEAAFYDALSRADIDAMMALWADDEDIVCIHPGAQRLVGHAAIRASFESIFERGSVQIRPLQLHATHNLMTAVHNIIEEVKSKSGEAQEVHILCTNVYLKTPLGWRITLHHASIAPGPMPAETPKMMLLH